MKVPAPGSNRRRPDLLFGNLELPRLGVLGRRIGPHADETTATDAQVPAVLDHSRTGLIPAHLDEDEVADLDSVSRDASCHAQNLPPGISSRHQSQVPSQHLLELHSELITGSSPTTDLAQSERTRVVQRLEVLVHDCIPPVDEVLQLPLAALVAMVLGPQAAPEIDAKTSEVCTQSGWRGVSAVQLPALGEVGPEDRTARCCAGLRHEMVGRLRMKVPREALQMRTKKDGVHLVESLGCMSSTRPNAADSSVGRLDLIELGGTVAPPALQGFGRQGRLPFSPTNGTSI